MREGVREREGMGEGVGNDPIIVKKKKDHPMNEVWVSV
jgi:hypothetical protein